MKTAAIALLGLIVCAPLTAQWAANNHLLSHVKAHGKDVAEISINGKPGPVLLLRPYRADVTTLLHAGENTLQVTVVNTQYNALSARGADRNFIPGPTDTANGLMPSGLMGPVRLEAATQQ